MPVVLSLILLLLPTILGTHPTTGSFLHAQSASPASASPGARAQAPAAPDDVFARVSPGVVALEVKSSRDGSYTGKDWRQRYPFGGTAFFIDPDGHLLTAASLVEKAGRIVLTDVAGRELSAGVVGISPAGGVALLRIVRRGDDPVTPLVLGSSGDVKVGDRAVSLGNPYGTIQRTGQVALSSGSVSGIYQVNGHGAYRGEVLETDAAVNPGAFGGPLLDARGAVIGILLDAFSYNRWLGTALPIDQVKALLPRLRRREEPGPGTIGIECEQRVIEQHRARITRVAPDSPAEQAGLRRGDEIVEFGGAALEDYARFLDALHALPAGSSVDLVVLRPGEAPADANREASAPEPDSLVRVTLKVGPPTEALPAAQRGTLGLAFKDDEDSPRHVVESVDAEGPAGKAGIAPGDVLEMLDGKRARPTLVASILERKRAGERVKAVFSRDGWTREFSLVLGPAGEKLAPAEEK
ncbi:MAG: PDZ domain-containing protein [Planctomycetes bacterium]|nr:PDZ domain-containing protein [Planctomycetota bacterium]